MVLSGRESSFVVERTAEQEHRLSERLYDAAARGSEVTVDMLLGEGVNPEWINPEGGLTPLLVATMNGREKCVLSLLRAGADIYATGAQGATALDLFVKLKTLFRLCNKLFRNRNYPAILAYLEKAHGDCRRHITRTSPTLCQTPTACHPFDYIYTGAAMKGRCPTSRASL